MSLLVTSCGCSYTSKRLLEHFLGGCKPQVVEVLPTDGDHVRVTGLVQVLKSEAPRDVRVQATVIQILESHCESH